MELKMLQRFMTLVEQGKKTTTIRRGHRHELIHYNSVTLVATEDANKKISITITNVYFVTLEQISDKNAIRDGFESRAKLVDALTDIYGSLLPTEPMTIVEFHVSK
jgi:hypothetical protein